MKTVNKLFGQNIFNWETGEDSKKYNYGNCYSGIPEGFWPGVVCNKSQGVKFNMRKMYDYNRFAESYVENAPLKPFNINQIKKKPTIIHERPGRKLNCKIFKVNGRQTDRCLN